MENWKTASTLSQNGERKPHGTSPRAIVGLSLWTHVYKHFCIHTCFSNIAFTYLLSLFEYTVLLQNKNIVVHIVLWPAFFWCIYWTSWTIFYFVNALIYSESNPICSHFLAIWFSPSDQYFCEYHWAQLLHSSYGGKKFESFNRTIAR